MQRYGLILFVSSLAVISATAAQPRRFNWHGKLTDSGGAPLSGPQTMFFSLFAGGDASTAGSGTEVFKETASVTFTGGIGSHSVGTGSNLVGGALTSDMLRTDVNVFLQVAVGLDT